MSNNEPRVIRATLARRLAEAADGFRNVNQVYFVAGYEPPHAIKDFPDFASANTFLNTLSDKDNYGIFGPYKTTDEFENSGVIGVENIEQVDITIHFKDHPNQQVTLVGDVESIYFNLSPLEKFVFPYYCHLFGVEYVKRLRDNLIAQNQFSVGGVIATYRRPRTIMPLLFPTLEDPTSEEL